MRCSRLGSPPTVAEVKSDLGPIMDITRTLPSRRFLALGDRHSVRDIRLPRSENHHYMFPFMNVGKCRRSELPLAFLAADEHKLGVLIDFEFLFDGRGR